MANQEKIFNLIEELNRKTLAEKCVNNKVTAEFEDNFSSNFPLKTFEDVLELDKLLVEKQNYKLLVIKTVYNTYNIIFANNTIPLNGIDVYCLSLL